jgi:2'-5' RNA ligase
MPSPLRLFVAWPLPEAVSRELGRVVAPLRARLPTASWPRAESLHLTFAFLGDTQPDRLPEIASALDRCGGFAPPEIRLEGIGVFPDERRPRVAWIGIEPQGPGVEIAAVVRRELGAAGVAFDAKPFRPHLTIARIKAPWRASDVAALRQAFQGWTSPATLDRIVLYSSALSPRGAVHAERHSVALRP